MKKLTKDLNVIISVTECFAHDYLNYEISNIRLIGLIRI